MRDQPPLPQPIRDQLPPEAQAAVAVLVQSFERRIADLEERLDKNSTNSSKPPSPDPPSVKRPPPAPSTDRKRGGQPGHRRQARPHVPPEQLRRIYRKLSGGTDSEAGSRFVERMLSVVATCRQQEINVLDYLTRCYQARLA